MVAHRVFRISLSGSDPRITAGSDFTRAQSEVPVCAITGIVDCVSYRLVSYRTGGPIGRLFSALALNDTRGWRFGRFAVTRICRLALKLGIIVL
jgi:hypothetical protein